MRSPQSEPARRERGRLGLSLPVRIIALFLLLAIPLNAVLAWSNLNARNSICDEAAASNGVLLELFLKIVDSKLNEVDNYLTNTIASSSDLYQMQLPEGGQYAYASIQVANSMQQQLNANSTAEALFVYSAPRGEMLLQVANAERKPFERASLLAAAEDGRLEEIAGRAWCPLSLDGAHFLFRVYKYMGGYIGACVRPEPLLSFVDAEALSGDELLFTDGAGNALSGGGSWAERGISLALGPAPYLRTGAAERYIVVGRTSRAGRFAALSVTPESRVLQSLYDSQFISWACIILSTAVILISFFIMEGLVVRPLRMITEGMRGFMNGDTHSRVEEDLHSGEMNLMARVFNQMVRQISSLRVSMYEEELAKQSAELRHLQLQVNPHFFLNSLNIIFQLAQTRRYDLIQEMASCLIRYFRFMFQTDREFVSLGEELAHTKNYIHIQEMRYPGSVRYTAEADEALCAARIPPLIVQTLVENSIKYALQADTRLELFVRVRRAGDTLVVSFRDNGPGFPEAVLRACEAGYTNRGADDAREHIGLRNVFRRLRLMYGERGALQIGNGPEGGMFAVMRLPYEVNADV